ncbi:cation-translocating P-type ATPase [Streptomyces sp. NRRL B-24720]|uniref:cation-translocating P-type ATPase n=1 Tax=Streptomyces sp. NRRL B-24720 TaxID=1476876 RepID=UPI0007C5A982|nr:cation-translocating P-type ATPase [Streptomyces sp. NRRL B-24720]
MARGLVADLSGTVFQAATAVTAAAAGRAATAAETGIRAGLAVVTATRPQPSCWSSGRRLHLALRPLPGSGPDHVELEAAARRVALALVEHADVLTAYWDGGLGRLVVTLADDVATQVVEKRAAGLAERHGLEQADEATLTAAHPAWSGRPRTHALALVCDMAGLATAVTGRVLRLRSSPPLITAAVTTVREHPRIRAALEQRLGDRTADLVIAATYAAAHGFGQSPTALCLDALLRSGQLVEAAARAAHFDALHDRLCAPGRGSVGVPGTARPALRVRSGEAYADQAMTGALAGAVGTFTFTRDTGEAAEAVLAASPRAARYGPTAFISALGTRLASQGVFVRHMERIRQLDEIDAIVLHSSVLSGDRMTILEVHPSAEDWSDARLWQAAAAALARQDDDTEAPGDGALGLRPVPGGEGEDTAVHMVIASAGGRDVGTVLVGREVEPRAESVLDAARGAGLHVVVTDDGSLAEFGGLADELVSAEEPLEETLRRLHAAGLLVVAAARVPVDGTKDDVRRGLLAADLAVAVTDDDSAVVWDADAFVLNGLEGLWRLLAAVPTARKVAQHAKILAEAGTALSELLVITRGSRGGRGRLRAGLRLSPVNAAAAAAMVLGWYGAVKATTLRAPHPRPRVPWHALEPREVLARTKEFAHQEASEAESATAAAGRVAGGVARAPVLVPVRLAFRLLLAVRAELDDPLTPVLAVGATASALLGSAVDALLVTGAVGMNALAGGVQRLRAELALEDLAVGQRQKARRVEDMESDATRTVEAGGLHPGEVVDLQTGDVVPADARVLEADDLEVDESSLTGESLPTLKQVDATPGASVPDRRSMVFEGATVVAGHGRAVVVNTGDDTEAGRAAHLASRTPPAAGVQARLRELTGHVLPLTLAGGAAVTAVSLIRGTPVREAVRGGLTVAVAAVPEGLPLTATVAQLAAARRLTAHGMLARTPRTLEALGRMDTLCFDKTGTLTENRLRVVRVASGDDIHPPDAPDAAAVLRTAVRTCPRDTDDRGRHAHATDAAIIEAAPDDPEWTSANALPFEASRGYASATGEDAEGTPLLVVKGAPEVVLPACRGGGGAATDTARALASEGLRVLAVAVRRLDRDEFQVALDRPLDEQGLDIVGFVALADTPRSDAAALVSGLQTAGVQPVMLTGDHPETARAVAVALGWPQDVGVVTGDDLATHDRGDRAEVVRDCGVVARVAPEQKLQVIEALREAGRVVGMVGDGSNDAAAIRAADVGVGIGAHGSAAARNAADLVIVGDELSVLLEAVAEGRALWHSVADAISVLIGGNAGEIGFSLFGTLLGGDSPLSTRQLLLVNLLTDMFPAMAVAVTPQESDGRPGVGRVGTAPVGLASLGAPLLREIRRRGIVTALGAFAAWLIGTLTPGSARRTSTMALCGVVGAQLTQTAAGRLHSPLVMLTVLGSAAALVALVQTPGVSQFFGCTPLGPLAWAGVASAIAVAALGSRVSQPVPATSPPRP